MHGRNTLRSARGCQCMAEQFTMERIFDATVQQVWDAWTVPAKLATWYNPHPKHDCVVENMDVRTGGAYRRKMPNGTDSPHIDEGIFHEVDAPYLLVQGTPDGAFKITTRLSKGGGGTRMELEMVGVPEAQFDHMRAAWTAGFDKMEHLF